MNESGEPPGSDPVGPEEMMVEAQEVYVVLNRKIRVSRNARALWYFENFNKEIRTNPEDDESELKIVGITGPHNANRFKLGSNTKVGQLSAV